VYHWMANYPNINQALKERKEYPVSEEKRKFLERLKEFYTDVRFDMDSVMLVSYVLKKGHYHGGERDILNKLRKEYIDYVKGRETGTV